MREVSQSPAKPSNAEPVDPSSWLDKHGDVLYNFALNRLHYHELAEEAVQETLMSAIRSINDFRGGATVRTWLFSILRNKISDLLRSDWTARSQVSLDDEANPERLLFDKHGTWVTDTFRHNRCELESRELHEIVMKCVQKLPRNQATIFVLRVLQEKNPEEICQDLQISTSNYWMRLHRARLAIANCVARHWPMEN
jgi:RNA polymerase sigma-70 factor (ECF subfamily)